MGDHWSVTVSDSFNRFTGKVLAFLPNLFEMITIFIIGFLIAWAVKKLCFRVLKAAQFDRLSEQWGLTHALATGGLTHSPSALLSQLFYWVILLATLILGINALELRATQELGARFFNYLPNLFVAILILAVGYLLSGFLGQATLIASVNAQLSSAKLFSRLVRAFIAALALTMAVYHLGIARKVILVAFTLICGGSVLALAIAFGWGGRDLARDFLEKLYRRKETDKEGRDRDRISHI